MLKEFKKFIMRGNVLDLAVGVIIGAAFGKIVASLTADIIMPLFAGIVGKVNLESLVLTIGESEVKYGAFLTSILDFLIVGLGVFIIVKIVNKLGDLKPKEVAAPTTKKCPFCLNAIAIDASRCPHCTSEQPAPEEKEEEESK